MDCILSSLIHLQKLYGQQNGTKWHYIALRQATVSVHRPIHSKILLTCSWQTDRCTHGFQGTIKHQGNNALLKPSLCLFKKLPEWAPTKTQLRVLQLHMWQSRIEIEYYSVVYFERITKFDALYH